MQYVLYFSPFGRSKLEIIKEFDVPSQISDICLIGDRLFFSLPLSNCLGFITTKGEVTIPCCGKVGISGSLSGYPNRVRFEAPTSICFDEANNIGFVTDGKHSLIRKFNVETLYVEDFLGEDAKETHVSLFARSRIKRDVIRSCAIDKNVFISHSFLNKCFKSNGNLSESHFGHGKHGFSICSDYKMSMLAGPEGLASNNEDVYLCDTRNHCIRVISGDSMNVFAGKPCTEGNISGPTGGSLLKNPRNIKIHNGFAYFIDDNSVKGININGLEIYSIRPSKGIYFVEFGKSKDLYMIGVKNGG